MTIIPSVLPPAGSTRGGPRILLLDVLRGVSLLGIAGLNAPVVLHLRVTATDPEALMLVHWSDVLLRDHFFPLFSLLFGVTFALLMIRAGRAGESALPLLLRRFGLLALFGLLHRLLQPGEVLLPYAICGLLLLPFRHVRVPLLLGLAALLVLAALWTSPVLLTPAMVLLGVAFGRLEVFSARWPVRPVLHRVVPPLTLLTLALTVAVHVLLGHPRRLLVVAGYDLDVVTLNGLVSAAALMTGLWLLLIRRPALPQALRPLALLGRMSLSNYVLQTLVFVALAVVGWRDGPYRLVVPACLLAYAANFALSTWWLARRPVGPLEWLWRWGSTLRRPS
ncbi:DUF418 domain-containing protein [Deinococcus sonorensis]|uniref:DUF418 domain-containing protein n=2 Tax=Deinococcus sonorensis TaxID=309891 RepID=A0AAU7U5C2_9DEIO